jgi:hypothetical protein
VPRPRLFVSKRRLQKQRPEPRKIVLGSIPSEDVFCSSDTNRQKNGAKTKVLCFEEEIIETPKTVLGSSPDEVLRSSKTKHKRRTA